MTTTHWFGVGLTCALGAFGCARETVARSAAAPSEVSLDPSRARDAAANVGPSGEPSGQPDTIDARESRHLARTWGWVLASWGVTTASFAIATSVLMLVDKSMRDGSCNPDKQCTPDGLQANQHLAELAGWNAGSWVVAAVSLGAGAYLLATHPADPASGVQVGLTSNGRGPGITLRARF